MSDPREDARKFLLEHSAMYRVLHSPRHLAAWIPAGLLVGFALAWVIS